MPFLVQGRAIHGYTEAVEQPFLVDPFITDPHAEGSHPKWWTVEGTARRAAALDREGYQQADVLERGEEEHGHAYQMPCSFNMFV
jgi:hypothetical protein